MPAHQLLSVFFFLHVPESSHSSCQLCKVMAQCLKFGFLFQNVKIYTAFIIYKIYQFIQRFCMWTFSLFFKRLCSLFYPLKSDHRNGSIILEKYALAKLNRFLETLFFKNVIFWALSRFHFAFIHSPLSFEVLFSELGMHLA